MPQEKQDITLAIPRQKTRRIETVDALFNPVTIDEVIPDDELGNVNGSRFTILDPDEVGSTIDTG